MFNVVLYQPEIPPNTGNIIRLCANTGSQLHLIRPLGFEMDTPALRRAGLDYHEYTNVCIHADLAAYLDYAPPTRLFACSSKVNRLYHSVEFKPGDTLLFGPETRGLPNSIIHKVPDQQRITIPMCTPSRSLNLSNAVAVVLYEAWRQNNFGLPHSG